MRMIPAWFVCALVVLVSPLPSLADLKDPPPSRFHTEYLFTGTVNSNGAITTSVHCTNLDDRSFHITVEFFDTAGTVVASQPLPMFAGETQTVSLQATFYSEAVLSVTTSIFQGSVRVSSDGPASKLICTAQVVIGLGTPPTVVIPLAGFDRNARAR